MSSDHPTCTWEQDTLPADLQQVSTLTGPASEKLTGHHRNTLSLVLFGFLFIRCRAESKTAGHHFQSAKPQMLRGCLSRGASPAPWLSLPTLAYLLLHLPAGGSQSQWKLSAGSSAQLQTNQLTWNAGKPPAWPTEYVTQALWCMGTAAFSTASKPGSSLPRQVSDAKMGTTFPIKSDLASQLLWKM